MSRVNENFCNLNDNFSMKYLRTTREPEWHWLLDILSYKIMKDVLEDRSFIGWFAC